MIDIESRTRASEILEKVKKEELTNWQLEDQWPTSETDPSLNCVLRWLWSLYNDDKEDKLLGLMSDEEKKILDNCIRFFKTGIELPIKKVSPEDEKKIRKEWGKEWRTDCTSPESNSNWPFPN